MSDQLIIFDTTLRDGEQSPGASMTRDEKLRIARQLERLKVDVIEAGFAASSNGDFDAVQLVANNIKDSTVCSLARANDRDIARAAEALKGARRSRIHTFIATSALHMEKKLRMTPDQVLEQAKQAVRFARNLVEDIETGFICVGQNWNGENVTETQKEVHGFYGFKPNNDLYWNWQYTKDVNDETQKSYKDSHKKFIKDTKLPEEK